MTILINKKRRKGNIGEPIKPIIKEIASMKRR